MVALPYVWGLRARQGKCIKEQLLARGPTDPREPRGAKPFARQTIERASPTASKALPVAQNPHSALTAQRSAQLLPYGI